MKKSIREAKYNCLKDRADYVWSTSRTPGDNNIMNDKLSAEILSKIDRDNKKYYMVVKFSRFFKKGWRVYDKHKRVMKTIKHLIEIINIKTKPVVLTGIDSEYYNQAYPVTVTTYVIALINQPDICEISPMRAYSMLNCVAEKVDKHVKHANRGNDLTDLKKSKITKWGESVKNTGAIKKKCC